MKYQLTYFLLILSALNINAQELRDNFSYVQTDSVEAHILEVKNLQKGNTREKVVIRGYDGKFPFYYYRNNKKSDKHLVLLHGLGGSKYDWSHPASRMKKLIDSLLILEYNIIIPDAKYHGERSFERQFKGVMPPEFTKSIDESKVLVETFSTTVRDVRIIFDYVGQRNPEANIQIDVLGYSMGGAISLLLNAVDNRINSIVACVAPVGRPYKEVLEFDWPSSIVEALKDITANYYSSFQQAPVILLMGKTDYFTTVNEGNSFIDGVKIKDKEIKFYDAGHGLPNEYIDDALVWITTHNKR